MNHLARLTFPLVLLSLSPTNAADLIEKRFHQLDTNHDGILSGDELNGAALLQKLDSVKQAPLTLPEVRKALIRLKGSGSLVDDPKVANGAPVGVQKTEILTESPGVLKGNDVGIGRQVANVLLQLPDKGQLKLSDATQHKLTVIALFGVSCPISNKLGPELSRLEKDYGNKGVTLLLVDTALNSKPEEVQRFLDLYGLKSPWFHDPEQGLQQALSATSTTEVFVLDPTRTLLYRGAIHDQYGLGYNREKPSKYFLREALDAIISDKTAPVAATSAPGCALDLRPQPASSTPALSYHKDVSRILQTHCIECHRIAGIAPFSLETYEDVLEHAGMIKKQVDRGVMPPWFAADHSRNLWSNDRSLSDNDKNDLLKWLASNRAVGNVADAPVPPRFMEEWTIGKPDAVLEMPKAIEVKAEGIMPYQYSVIETSFPEDRWVQAYEIIPQARNVVHHVIVSMHEKGASSHARENAAAGFWAAYVPGNSLRNMPPGFAKRLPAGARLRLQIHYTPNGQAVQDKIKIGLVFAKEAPLYEVHVSSIANPRIRIPAGAPNHLETAQKTLSEPLMITGYMAHMHVRGKSFKYEVLTPGQPPEVLLDLPRYDFNWQLQYTYAQPKVIPAGSTLKITAVFDNSAGNPANPDPSKEVRWGEQTNNEMMIGYIEHFSAIPSMQKP